VGRFHIPDWRALGCTSGRPDIPDRRPQEVPAAPRDSHDGWMAVNHALRESSKFLIK